MHTNNSQQPNSVNKATNALAQDTRCKMSSAGNNNEAVKEAQIPSAFASIQDCQFSQFGQSLAGKQSAADKEKKTVFIVL